MRDRVDLLLIAAASVVLLAVITRPVGAVPVLGGWEAIDYGFPPVDSPPPGPPPGGSSEDTDLRYVTHDDGTVWYEDRADGNKLYWAEDTGTWPQYDFNDDWGAADTSALTQWGLHPEVFSTGTGRGLYYWDHYVQDTIYYADDADGGLGRVWAGETLVTFGGAQIQSAGVVDVVILGDTTRLYLTARDLPGDSLGVYVAESTTPGDYTLFGPAAQIIPATLSPATGGWTPTGAVGQTSWGGWIMTLVDDGNGGVYLAESWDGLSNWTLLNGGVPIIPGIGAGHLGLMEHDLLARDPDQWDILYDAVSGTYPYPRLLGLASLEVIVPEPGSLLLLAVGAALVIGALRRKRDTS